MGYRLGIDLGTTYTAAALCRDGRAEMLALGDRSPVIPSVVAIREDGTVLTGEAAERRVAIEPDRVAREFKRRFGDPAPMLLGGAPYGAEVLQAHLLRAVVDKATEREGEPPERIALTHPANWGPYKLELVDQVIALAGLDPTEVDLLTEPEAAAIHYASQQRVEPGALVAVYDLGGGTFDAAVLRRTATGYEIAGPPSGIERLGGIDLDAAVFAFVQGQLDDGAEVDPDDPDALAALASLRRDCVAGKEALAADTDTEIVAMLPGVHERIRLTRAEFEDMARPSIEQTVVALQRAIVAAELQPSDLTSVLLVGGSSRIPLVAQAVGNAIGRPVAVDTHPKYAVALGAALAGEEHVEEAVIATPEVVPVPVILPPPPAYASTASVSPPSAPAVQAPPVPPAAPPPAAPDPTSAGRQEPPKKRKGVLIGVVAVLALIAAVAGFSLFGGSADASELVLESKGALGENPFSDEPGLAGTPPEVTPVTFDTGGASGDTIVVSERGTAPGLYGGTRNVSECDPAELVQFLQDNPGEAAAWAEVQGIEASDIGDFVDGLTSVTLISDTRVTNHGFTDGAANPVQSVLEAGTAVLVDEFGVPRVKCNCGNPLLEPETLSGSVETNGTPWPDFDATKLLAVTPGDLAVSRVVLSDIEGGDPFSRGVGTSGDDDAECDAACGL